MAIAETYAVNINDIEFGYPDNPEVSFTQLNLKIAKGERFGLFGPNGAGKTTLMNLMTGLLKVNKGSISLLGHDVNKHNNTVSKLFGFVPQDFSFYQELSPVENLEFFGAWSGLNKQQINQRIDELLDILGLDDVRNKQVQKFSGGMKRRVNLAIGVIHNPPVLFLDEPTVGVDVQTRHAIINYLKILNESGTTLIYTSHQLSEAEGLCEQVALLDDRKIITPGNIHSLLKEHQHNTLEELFIDLTGKEYRD
jgi:ABC-2 type transport system ATP-binding protein